MGSIKDAEHLAGVAKVCLDLGSFFSFEFPHNTQKRVPPSPPPPKLGTRMVMLASPTQKRPDS